MIFFHKKEAEKIELGARPGSTLGILEEFKKKLVRCYSQLSKVFFTVSLRTGHGSATEFVFVFANLITIFPPLVKKNKTRNVHASIKKVKVNKNWHEIRQITFRI